MIDTKRITHTTGDAYAEALRLFRTARWPHLGKPISKNVRLHEAGEYALSVRLYNTDIVTLERISPESTAVTLYTGGWETRTTQRWMNEWAPGAYITQKNYRWYCRLGRRFFAFENNTVTYLAKHG